MFWIIACVIVSLGLVIGLIYIFLKDRRLEKGSVVQTMSDSLWDDIAKEREEGLARSKKFKEALESARKIP